MILETRDRLNAKCDKVMAQIGIDRRAAEMAQPHVDQEVELKKDEEIEIKDDDKIVIQDNREITTERNIGINIQEEDTDYRLALFLAENMYQGSYKPTEENLDSSERPFEINLGGDRPLSRLWRKVCSIISSLYLIIMLIIWKLFPKVTRELPRNPVVQDLDMNVLSDKAIGQSKFSNKVLYR